MEKVKDPSTIVSLGTAMGMVLASFYFFNRLNSMQADLDGVKKTVSDLTNTVAAVNSRVNGFVSAAKKTNNDYKSLSKKFQSLSRDFESGMSSKKRSKSEKEKKRETYKTPYHRDDSDDEDQNSSDEDTAVDRDLRELSTNLDRSFSRQN